MPTQRKDEWSGREKALGGGIAFLVAVQFGGALLENMTGRLLQHPDDHTAHPVVAVQSLVDKTARHDATFEKVEAGLDKINSTLRSLEKDRALREEQKENERRDFWLQQRERDRQANVEATRSAVLEGLRYRGARGDDTRP